MPVIFQYTPQYGFWFPFFALTHRKTDRVENRIALERDSGFKSFSTQTHVTFTVSNVT